MVEVGDPRVEAQKFLSALPSSEPLLASLLSPRGSVFLLNDIVAAGCGNHLLVVDVSQAWDLPDSGSVAAKLVGMNDLWSSVFPSSLVRKVFGEERSELDSPFAQRFVAHLETSLAQHCLHVTVPQRKALGQPLGACWMIVMGKR